MSSGTVPPLYPNFVSTDPSCTTLQISRIKRMIAEAPDRSFAVKDSFRTLDLSSLGFEVLFEAEWYLRPSFVQAPLANETVIGWSDLKLAAELLDWETAWRKARGMEELLPRPFFPSQLLANANVNVLVCRTGDTITAGAIAFRNQETIGLTNFFAPAEARGTQFAGCLAFVSQAYPALSIVGYEEPGFAQNFEALSVNTAGPLRVWLK